MKKTSIGLLHAAGFLCVLTVVVCGQTIFNGDGTYEPGFVPPPPKPALPPKPPAVTSSAESYIPYPGPPVAPLARSELKRPPLPPVLFTKLTSEYGTIDWSARPNDLPNLMRILKRTADLNYSCNAMSVQEINEDPEKNPILYRSGHFRFSWTPEERARLRAFLLNGGMLLMNANMGSKPFYDSALKEVVEIFPEIPIQRLAPDHPLLHAYYDIEKAGYRRGVREAGYEGDEPWLEGITIDCRVVAVVSRWGLEVGWDDVPDENIRAYDTATARKLAHNLAVYAAAQRAWTKRSARAMAFADSTDTATAGKSTYVAQIMYAGEWKTRHAGLSILLHQFNRKTGVPVKFAHKELALTDPTLFDSPLIYITGHEPFTFSNAEIAALREYLRKGGFLFAEACCGRVAFDRAFRREMARVMPGSTLKALPANHMIFSLPNAIRAVGVTPGLAAQFENHQRIPPELLGMDIGGRLGVVYSPFGLAGGWELAQNPYALGYEDASALAIGENVLMTAITQ
jgi:hypothetical protein